MPFRRRCTRRSQRGIYRRTSRRHGRRLTILSYNVAGFSSSRLELQRYLRLARPDIVCLQETHHLDTTAIRLPGYRVEHLPGVRLASRGRLSGGLITLVRCGLKYHTSVQVTYADSSNAYMILGVLLLSAQQTPPLTILNCYFRPAITLTETGLPDLPPERCLLVGDVNAHHPGWDLSVVEQPDRRGQIIWEWLYDSNLRLLGNPTDPPTYLGQRHSGSTIDIAAISKPIRSQFTSTVLSNALAHSDHMPLKVQWTPGTPFAQSSHSRHKRLLWNFRKANWSQYQQALDNHLLRIRWSDSVDRINSNITTAILQAARAHIPRGKLSSYKTYWSDELESLRLQKNRIRRSIHTRRRNRLPWDRLRGQFWSISQQYTYAIRAAQKRQWEEFTTGLTMSHRKEWKAVRTLAFGATPRSDITIDGLTGQSAAQRYSRYLSGDVYSSRLTHSNCKEWRRRNNAMEKRRKRDHRRLQQKLATSHPRDIWQASYHEQASIEQGEPFTLEEYHRALTSLNKSSSSGPDQILPHFLTHGTELLTRAVVRLISKSLGTTQLPAIWKLSRVIVIKKTSISMTEATAKDFRPISVTCLFARLAESMVVYRAESQLERDDATGNETGDFIDGHQHGFRAGRTLDEETAYVHSSISEHVRAGRIVTFVSLDWTKAYDTVTLPVLYSQLMLSPIHITLCKWLWAFLRGRRFYVEVDGAKSSTRSQKHGLPQGCICSPLLWTLYLNPLIMKLSALCSLQTHPAYRLAGVAAYADDLCLWSVGNVQEEADYRLNHALRIVESWALETGMALSSAKTNLVYFRRTRQRRVTPQTIYLNDEWLPVKDEARVLGVIFDTTLSWRSHIKKLRQVVRQRCLVLRRLTSTPSKIIRRLFQQFIQWPFLLGAAAWAWHLSVVQWRTLQGCYRMAIKSILGCRKWSSPGLALRLADYPPLEVLLTQHCDKVLERCCRIPISPLRELCAKRCIHPITCTGSPTVKDCYSVVHYATLRCPSLFVDPPTRLYLYPPIPPAMATTPIAGRTTLKEALPPTPTTDDYKLAALATLSHYMAQRYLILIVDGSYTPPTDRPHGNSAGYAWLLMAPPAPPRIQGYRYISHQAYPLGPNIHSSYEAELRGINHAVFHFLISSAAQEHFKLCNGIVILNDNQALINHLTHGWLTSSPERELIWDTLWLLRELWHQLPTTIRYAPEVITLQWIKGHIGLELHDKVDTMARSQQDLPEFFPPETWAGTLQRLGAERRLAYRSAASPIPGEEEFTQQNKRLRLAFTRYTWLHDALHEFPRSEQTLLYRLRLQVLPLYHKSLCPGCGRVPFTIKHLLLQCPTYTLDRPLTFPVVIPPNEEDYYFYKLLYTEKAYMEAAVRIAQLCGCTL